MPYSASQTAAPPTSPLFSVVTVCLNPGATFAATADSVFRQSFGSFEWVIKDGLSENGPDPSLCQNPRVNLVSRKDEGIFDAMNQALDSCVGDYVLFLNVGDVFCRPDSLQRVAECIEEHERPEIVYSFYEYGCRGNVIKYPARLDSSFLYRRFVCHQATLIRRDCYARFGRFQTVFTVGADDELLARLVLGHGVRCQRCPVATVRVEAWNYSARPENRILERQAHDFIRQRYFSPAQRQWNRICYAATFPGLRSKCVALPIHSPWRRLYVAFSNFVNAHL